MRACRAAGAIVAIPPSSLATQMRTSDSNPFGPMAALIGAADGWDRLNLAERKEFTALQSGGAAPGHASIFIPRGTPSFWFIRFRGFHSSDPPNKPASELPFPDACEFSAMEASQEVCEECLSVFPARGLPEHA